MSAIQGASDAHPVAVGTAAACLALALFAAWRERRRAGRHDPDAVGWVDWVAVQMLALIALAATLLLLAKGG